MITPKHRLPQGEEAAIVVYLDTRTADGPRHFRCSVCGNIVFEDYPPYLIMPGTPEKTKQIPTVVQCPHSIRVPKDDGTFVFLKCKTRYYIVK